MVVSGLAPGAFQRLNDGCFSEGCTLITRYKLQEYEKTKSGGQSSIKENRKNK